MDKLKYKETRPELIRLPPLYMSFDQITNSIDQSYNPHDIPVVSDKRDVRVPANPVPVGMGADYLSMSYTMPAAPIDKFENYNVRLDLNRDNRYYPGAAMKLLSLTKMVEDLQGKLSVAQKKQVRDEMVEVVDEGKIDLGNNDQVKNLIVAALGSIRLPKDRKYWELPFVLDWEYYTLHVGRIQLFILNNAIDREAEGITINRPIFSTDYTTTLDLAGFQLAFRSPRGQTKYMLTEGLVNKHAIGLISRQQLRPIVENRLLEHMPWSRKFDNMLLEDLVKLLPKQDRADFAVGDLSKSIREPVIPDGRRFRDGEERREDSSNVRKEDEDEKEQDPRSAANPAEE